MLEIVDNCSLNLIKALDEDFDFKKVCMYFQEEEGFICWVCDKRARQLKDSVRKSIVDY